MKKLYNIICCDYEFTGVNEQDEHSATVSRLKTQDRREMSQSSGVISNKTKQNKKQSLQKNCNNKTEWRNGNDLI